MVDKSMHLSLLLKVIGNLLLLSITAGSSYFMVTGRLNNASCFPHILSLGIPSATPMGPLYSHFNKQSAPMLVMNDCTTKSYFILQMRRRMHIFLMVTFLLVYLTN
jgi:hypothetical protein